MTQQEIVRTKRDGCWSPKVSTWGSFYVKVDDPDATVVSKKELEEFTLKPNFPKIPGDLWQAVIQFYFHYARQGLEAQVLLLLSLETKQDWKIVVPEQIVSGASVETKDFSKAVDILTGEPIEHWEPEGYAHCGSGHSHHRMLVSFSHEDDENELEVPGIHILVKGINLKANTYAIDASVVQARQRFIVPYQDIIETKESQQLVKPHPNCFKMVKEEPKLQRPLPLVSGRYPAGKTHSKDLGAYWDQYYINQKAQEQSIYDSWYDTDGFEDPQHQTEETLLQNLADIVSELRFRGYAVSEIHSFVEETVCQTT
jgi:hypothetical protein